MEEKTLTGENLEIILTPLLRKDSSILFEWINDRELTLFNAPYKPVMEKNHEQWFDSLPQRQDLVIFAIRYGITEDLIGTCQLHSINWLNRNAELQIRIGNMYYQNKGLGTKAIQKLLSFGFQDLNLHRIYLHVFEDNLRAIKVYEKNGFQREGLLRESVFISGSYKNILIMSVLNKEFNAS